MSKHKKPQPGTNYRDALRRDLRKLMTPRKRKPSPPPFDLEKARRKVEEVLHDESDSSGWCQGFDHALRWVLSEVLTRKGTLNERPKKRDRSSS